VFQRDISVKLSDTFAEIVCVAPIYFQYKYQKVFFKNNIAPRGTLY